MGGVVASTRVRVAADGRLWARWRVAFATVVDSGASKALDSFRKRSNIVALLVPAPAAALLAN